MRYYKGDIIYEQKDFKNNVDHLGLWAINLFGVLETTECEGKILFYRPFKNHVKHLLYCISKIIF